MANLGRGEQTRKAVKNALDSMALNVEYELNEICSFARYGHIQGLKRQTMSNYLRRYIPTGQMKHRLKAYRTKKFCWLVNLSFWIKTQEITEV